LTRGFAPDAALRAHKNAAGRRSLASPDRLGSIETAKIANLIVADGDSSRKKQRSKWFFVVAEI